MKLIPTLLAATLLSGCATVPPSAPQPVEGVLIAAEIAAAPAADRIEIAAGVATEITARFHCPATDAQLGILAGARLSFDLFVRGRITAQSGDIVDRLRLRTNEACGLSTLS